MGINKKTVKLGSPLFVLYNLEGDTPKKKNEEEY